MRIYDTMKKKKVDLETVEKKKVGIYLCGPTVYDYGHLGHGRSAVCFDLLRRYLSYRGYEVTFVRNWTDIDDKTIERAKAEHTTVQELTERFIRIYEEDFEKLGILEPDEAPKPTEHIPGIVSFIERLFEREHAYLLEDGVYYDISTFDDYGKLSGQRLEDLKQGVRVDVAEGKRNPGDFALWKFEKPGEPSWPSPWGNGRPGWHIECSVMSGRYLKEEFDIHCGGQDLIFPHHEDEIAQSRGAGYRFARYWMHNGFLNIDNEKMSKSLGNFFTLRQAFELFSPKAVRFFLISSHYRAPLNFSEETLRQAEAALQRFNDFIGRVAEAKQGERGGTAETIDAGIRRAREGFTEGLDDDLNVSKALAALSDFVRDVNVLMEKGELGSESAGLVIEFMKEIDKVLGVFSFEKKKLDGEIEKLIEERIFARRKKEFARADAIRDRLLKMGIVLEDTKDGTRWKRA
ncbi:MAG: cysteine--tRNA ligase [Spirochaetes bacterium]|nr:cysteine--tRNA ligase [Spirochaetota bacterium]